MRGLGPEVRRSDGCIAEWWDKTYEWISMVHLWMKTGIRRSLDSSHDHFMHPEVEEGPDGSQLTYPVDIRRTNWGQ
jgi:hypothetical protein